MAVPIQQSPFFSLLSTGDDSMSEGGSGMTEAANIKEAQGYRYQGRRFSWRPLEEWSFDSPLSPEELRARLEATWDHPFRVFGRRAWRVYRLCAVFRRDGSVVVRVFNNENRHKFVRHLNPVRLTKRPGQRFIGRIKATEEGSRLEGWAEYGNFGRELFWTICWFVAFVAFVRAAPSGPGYFLSAFALAGIVFQCFALPGSTLLASRHREAFWRFLDAATSTPPGEPLRDDVHLENEELKEAKAQAS
jgi:hypothetical protein